MFIAALFTLGKTFKAPDVQCVKTKIKKLWCTYTICILISYQKDTSEPILVM